MVDDTFVQWEVQIVGLALNGDPVQALNKMGDDGWEPWGIIGPAEAQTPEGPIPILQIGIKRHKRKISLSTDIMGALQR